jgi:DNA repair exonuclease SbcCD ATPase subunit
MRLLSLTVRNYRIHRDITVDFDPARNLVGGPNETGKSTLAEAIHRALFMRYKSGGDLQKSMVSGIHGGHPEVKLTFEAAGDVWTIEKQFSGTKGTARLSSQSGVSKQGDAAEEKLAELTANPDGATNNLNQLLTRWAHLWVLQGTAGTDASAHAASRRDELIQRLQENGLAAVMQSEKDEQTREKISAIRDTIFTRNGTIKTGSRLDLAARSLTDANEKLTAATEQKQRLESAIADQESATRDLATSEAALPGLRDQLTVANDSLAKARELDARSEKQQLVHQQAATTLDNLTQSDQQIRSLLAQAAAARDALAPAEQTLADLSGQTAAAATKAGEAKAAYDAMGDSLRLARQHHDLSQACISRFEKADAHKTLTARAKEIEEIHQSLIADRDALSRLPTISQAQLDKLRELDAQQAQARSALEAIATGIELIESPHAVLLDQHALVPGNPRVITETSELSLADGTRLRIQPGGGTSLASCRQKADDLEKQFSILLDQLAVADASQASGIFTQRQMLERQITVTQTRLNDLGAPGLSEALAAAADALAAATAEVDRRLSMFPADEAPTLPVSLADAQAWHIQTRDALHVAEQQEQSLRAEANASQSAYQEKLSSQQNAQQSLETKRREISNLEATARTFEQIHGDATARAQKISTASAEATAAKAALDATKAALAELNPERLAQEVSRLERVITNEKSKQQEAQTRLAVAQNTLASDGTNDPEADLLRAKARHATATDEYAREKRHADAIDLLHRLFSEGRESISRSVTQPIADRVASYLECLFGRGVRIDVDWSDPTKPTLHITRPGEPTFVFDTLSGGAREQVAAAVRLATAEILAASHNGCLPILFDDSFAYSDAGRIQSLQSMLDLAAARGLQVLVLTCAPADYIGFGARETRLTPVARASCPEPAQT